MSKALFILVALLWSAETRAQHNLYVPTAQSSFIHLNNIIEAGNHVYYLTDRHDTINATATRSYYLNRINKISYAIEGSKLLFVDTAFNRNEEFQMLAVSYALDPVTQRINIFFVTDVDSSLNENSAVMKFPKRISYMQLDSSLSTTISERAMIFSQRNSRYALNVLGNVMIGVDGRSVLIYAVRDTNVITNPHTYSSAFKFLLVDENGQLAGDDFLGWEPTGSDSRFPSHNVTDVWERKDGTYAARTWFEDGIDGGKMFTLFMFDHNMNLTDTFDYPLGHFGNNLPGKRVENFGEEPDNLFFLPTGSLVRSGGIFYRDAYTGIDHLVYGVGKGGRESGYRVTQLYAPPLADSSDQWHSAAINSAAYNPFDNCIYSYSATNKSSNGSCISTSPGVGQLIALDTNLNERWIKHVRPRSGRCINSLSVSPADKRNGILISGWQASSADPNNQSLWEPYIYHIDSSTSLGINSPIIITDQFTLYPNPATDRITVENVLGTRYTYSIINSIGQQVASGKGEGVTTGVDVQALPAGIYLIRCITADNRGYSLKFQKS